MDVTESSIVFNASTADLPLEDLQKEYMNLKKTLVKVQQELETKNQQLYDCKRQLNTAEVLEKEYQQEIETLQNGESVEQNKLKAKIVALEIEVSEIKQSSDEHAQFLESELLIKSDEIKELQTELKNLCDSASAKSDSEENKLREENAKLKSQLETLQSEFEQLQGDCALLEKEKSVLNETVGHLKDEVDCLKQTLRNRHLEFEVTHKWADELQEELALVKSELEAFKSKPLTEESKGNSLFAEVDDRRVKLQRDVTAMKIRYIEMKRECGNYTKQISLLRAENMKLIKRLDVEIKGKENDNQVVLNSYKQRVETLESVIENYKREVAERQTLVGTNISAGELRFLENILDQKRKEIESLRQQLCTYSLKETLLAGELKQANTEIRSLKLKTIELEHEIGQLQDQLKDQHVSKIHIDEQFSAEKSPELKMGILKQTENIQNPIDVNKYANNIDFSRLLRRLTIEGEKKVETEENKGKSGVENNVNDSERGKENEVVKNENEVGERKVKFAGDVKSGSENSQGVRRINVKVLRSNPVYVPSRKQ